MCAVRGVLERWRSNLQEYVENEDEAAVEITKQECSIWYYLIGFGLDITTWRGLLCYTLYYSTCFAILSTHSILAFLTGLFTISESRTYACFMFYVTINGLWGLAIALSTFSERKTIFQVHAFISKNFLTYDHEVEIRAAKIKDFHRLFQAKFHLVPVVVCMSIIFMVIFFPFVLNSNAVCKKALIPTYYPFTVESREFGVILSVFQLLYVAIIFIFIFFGAFIFLNSSIHWVYQMQRLIDSISMLDERAMVMYRKKDSFNFFKQIKLITIDDIRSDKTFVNCMIDCLKENVTHHHISKRFIDEGRASIDLPLGAILLLSSLLLALLILLVVDGAILTPGVLMLGSTGGLFALSLVGQFTIDMTLGVRQAAYETNWPGSNKRVVSLIKILMEANKEPKRPRALGLLPYDKEAFLAIIKAAYSSYSFLILSYSDHSPKDIF